MKRVAQLFVFVIFLSLAGPAFGIRSTRSGKAERIRYGRAIPPPMAAKVVRVVRGGWVAAQAAAAPMKGAVQGVDKTAARMPNPKDPCGLSCSGLII